MKGWKALIALIVLALAATVGGSQDAYAAKRVALVIGNSDYTSFPKLDNPVKDGESLRDALISIDFDVVFRKNVTLDGFADGLAEFVEKARSAEVAIVYYAGHGVQHDERNYLIPVNGKAQDLDDLDFRSEPVDMVVRALQRAPGTRILILDACRNNPAADRDVAFRSVGDDPSRSGGAGLAAPHLDPRNGMIVAYATAADHVAADAIGADGHSPYNSALVKWVVAPDLGVKAIIDRVGREVQAVTKNSQRPEMYSNVYDDYVLNPSSSEWVEWANVKNSQDIDKLQHFVDAHPNSAHAPQAKHQIEILQQNQAEAAWDRLKDGSDLAAFKTFRDRYPASTHASEADRKIAALQQKADDEAREAAAWERARSASDLDTVQAFRTAYPNSPHAAEADQKIAALKRAEEQKQLEEAAWDGVKTGSDLAALQAFLALYPNSSHMAEGRQKLALLRKAIDDQQRENAEWGRVKDLLNPAALQDFLDRHPKSQYTAEAEEQIIAARTESAWDQVKNTSSDISALQDFKDRYPRSPHAAEADRKIAAIQAQRSEKAWDGVKNSADSQALQRFEDTYPNSPHVAEAVRKIADLSQKSEDPWIELTWESVKNDPVQLQAFMKLYPKSPHALEAARKLAALQKESADQQRRQEEADKARKADETCSEEAAEIAGFVKDHSSGGLEALRGRAACPKTVAAIDVALRDLRAQDCVAERDRVRASSNDLEALREELGALTCDAAVADAKSRIGQLEMQAAQIKKGCDDATDQVDNKIDLSEASARARLEKFTAATNCPSARDDAVGRIKEIDERVDSAQHLLAKFGCYKTEPPSGRFDKATEDAIGKFERGAHQSGDATHLTPDLLREMQGYSETGVCPAAAPPPPVASIPRETLPPEPTNRLHEKRLPQSKKEEVRPSPRETRPREREALPPRIARRQELRPPLSTERAQPQRSPPAATSSAGAKPPIWNIPN